ncbi:MAG: hypothetical protein E6Q27_07730 [Aeromicrobium sp.]|nr:MAG: hypothetical protein E6Q27_07730 [Aeromicrobium sp.]
MGVTVSEKIDFKKTFSTYHAKVGVFDIVEVPIQRFLMVDGAGDPNTSPAYVDALEVLYPFSYALKFHSKRELERDYVVPPLEGLWWAEDMSSFTSERDKNAWQWTMMLYVPEWLSADDVEVARLSAGKKQRPSALDKVRFETLDEGLCVQTLHIGSYEDEGPVLQRMHNDVMTTEELTMTGKHHEIYLSDPRRVAPEKLRTILRQPVTRRFDGPANTP